MSVSKGQPELAPAAGADSTQARGRLRQIEALRVLTCLSVIACHVVGIVYQPPSLVYGFGTIFFHYSREIFFFVSALVLVRSYLPRLDPNGRLPARLKFRRRRFRLIGVPYLVWTTIYVLATFWPTAGDRTPVANFFFLLATWLHDVLLFSAKYHLYFLAVTLEFTLVFPLFLRLLRRTQGRHWQLLICSYGLQLAILTYIHFITGPAVSSAGDGPEVGGWWDAAQVVLVVANLIVYQLWLVAGGLAGLHLERVHTWVVEHKTLVLGAVPVAALLLLGTYLVQEPARGGADAATPNQPIILVWATAMLGALYLAADRLSRIDHALARNVVKYGARWSFGIFLAHPLVLDLVIAVSKRTGWFAPSLASLSATYVLTVAGAVALCALFDRSRFSLALIGRQRLPRRADPKPVDGAETVSS